MIQARRQLSAPVAATLLLAVLFASRSPVQVFAQSRIEQTGQLLDANPALGGSRFNYGVGHPVSPLWNGNMSASGNVRFGRSLRGVSPISDPTAFRGALGSSSLSNFIRDSVSGFDRSVVRDRGGLTPYFDPARTAPTANYLLGRAEYSPWNRDGTIARSGPGRINSSLAKQFRLPDGRINRSAAGQRPFGVDNAASRPLSSSIFGVQAGSLPGSLILDSRQPYVPRRRSDATNSSDNGGWPGASGLRRTDAPGLTHRLPGATPLGARLDAMLRQDPADALARRRLGRSTGFDSADEVADALGRTTQFQQPASTGIARSANADLSMLPGHNVFTDMQWAISIEDSGEQGWFARMRDAVGTDPALARESQEFLSDESEQLVKRLLDSRIHTFVGSSASAFNDELLKAEEAMHHGRYYDAARMYDRARLMEPANPLVRLGKAHALLAAGEYVSAGFNLVHGLERYPELTRFDLDLTTMLGGGEIVDIRRADIMQLLERREDPELRFLLGYLEYYGDNRAFGLENLERAASAAPLGSLVRRYPSLLTGSGALPPAELPPTVETAEPAGEQP